MALTPYLAPLHLRVVEGVEMGLQPTQQTLADQAAVEPMLVGQLQVEPEIPHRPLLPKVATAAMEYRQILTLVLAVVAVQVLLVEAPRQVLLQMLLVVQEPHRLLAVLL